MLDFASLTLITRKENPSDNFVGIRKSALGDGYEFCLPNGFDDFPDGDFDAVRDFFFKMYRTFRKFERDNIGTNRFQKNQREFQQDQDQTTLSGGGISMQTEDGEDCVLYSKIKMIERVLEAYDDLAINSIQKKVRRSEEIDYSQIHKYLDRAIYLDNLDTHVIYIDAMDLPRPTVRYESTDIVNLYCYILDEIVQQLDGDVPDNIQARVQDIRFLAQHFQDDYLTSNQSIFDKDTFAETISILKEALDNIDKNTYYKDADYWGLYEAIETFLYGEINPDQNDGDFWGVKGFSYVWEDMCSTYFFQRHRKTNLICYADTDIPLKNYSNNQRVPEETNRVGNYSIKIPDKSGSSETKLIWIYTSNFNSNLSWYQIFCIEFNSDKRTGDLRYESLPGYTAKSIPRLRPRFIRPDLVLKVENNKIKIYDYKDVSIDLYKKRQTDKKYIDDMNKSLTYEFAIQQTGHEISANYFFIPWYYDNNDIISRLNRLGCPDSELDIKGIKVFKANFAFIQSEYLKESV